MNIRKDKLSFTKNTYVSSTGERLEIYQCIM